MKAPDFPKNEDNRLAALQALNILDTDPEERFDRITRLAKRTFDVPIALVSLIDRDRQWFKSKQGLCACETSRDISFCGHAILSDELFVVTDTLNDDRFRDNPLVTGAPKIRFYAGLPLSVANGIRLGTLCIIDQMPRRLNSADRSAMRDLGFLAQQELSSAPLTVLDELQQRNQELGFLSQLSDFLQASLSIEEAFAVITNLVEPLFPNCSGGIFTICASRNRVEVKAAWGVHQHSVPDFSPHACWALRRGRSHAVTGDRLGLQCNHVTTANSPMAASLCIPMIAQGETLGLFFLSSDAPAALSPSKQRLAHTVAEQAALAIANLYLRETLQQQSIRDSLTSLYNRRYLEEALRQEIARAEHQPYPISVVMLELDQFKQFKERHGHDAADYVLQKTCQLLKAHLRESDIACRYSGEEMILVLPQADLAEAHARADKIQQQLSQLSLSHEGSRLRALTVAYGIACFPKDGTTVTSLIQVANTALQVAKAESVQPEPNDMKLLNSPPRK